MALRILHPVEFYAPSVGGAQAVVRQVSERLADEGHHVTVATTAHPDRTEKSMNGVDVVGFEVAGNEVRGMTGDVEDYRRFVREGDFDVVMAYAAQQWTVDALLPVIGDLRSPFVLAPCGFSGLRDPAYAGYFDRLGAHLRAADALIFHSDTYQDIRFARDAGAEAITVIPNGADEREFGQLPPTATFRDVHGISEGAPMLLTVGSHTGVKGHAQAMDVLRASQEARGATLALVGNTPLGGGCFSRCRVRAAATRLVGRGRRVVLADPPRSQVVAAYADADLFLFCSMVECSPLVLFEAMAAGLPFVSIDVGNAREIAEWSGAGVIVPSQRRPDGLLTADTGAVAEAVDALLADPERREEMGASGRRAWEQRFTWKTVARSYGDLYERLAAA